MAVLKTGMMLGTLIEVSLYLGVTQGPQRFQFDRDPNQSTDRSKKRSIDRPAEALANRSTVSEPRSDRPFLSLDPIDRLISRIDRSISLTKLDLATVWRCG